MENMKMMKHCRLLRMVAALGFVLALAGTLPAAAEKPQADAREYFVNLQGDDDNDGFPRERAFRTVQKGLSALAAGDTLTIGPGEYFENASRTNLGNMAADTVIRSEIPGTALLRGDVPAPVFRKVDGYRFVYAAPFAQTPQAVLEHNTLRVMHPKANVAELEFDPGFFCYDTNSRTLYLSNPDLGAPDQRRFTVAVSGHQGLELSSPRRVIIEGLAVAGFYPGWGLLLVSPNSCVVRDCVTYLNIGGINLCPANGIGGNDGSNNVVENCVSYGNSFAGIARYGANHDIIRNCHLYKNICEGAEHFGFIHYGSMSGPLLITNNISWGHNFNYSVKPGGQQERLEHCVTLGYIRIANMFHDLIGGGNEYDRGASATADNILLLREQKLDRDFEFADPLNLDFRLQPDSRFRGTAPDKTDRGPYPYVANIFYVSPAGDDQSDGLSMRKPWRTLERSLKGLRPADTLYLAEGAYAAATWKKAGGGKEPIRVCGRGRATVVVTGKLEVARSAGIVFERVNFSAGVVLGESRELAFKNCTFYGSADGLHADKVKDLKVTHSVFAGVPLELGKTEGVTLSGNIHANAGKPAVMMDSAGAIRYSDYNNYQNTAPCWQVNRAGWSLAEVQKSHERYSQSKAPELAVEQGVPRLKNDNGFKSLGPHSTALGLHYEYEPVSDAMDLVGPFLHTANDTTANIEWWSSHAATYVLAWGETPQMTNVVRTLGSPQRFTTISLTGLKPGQTYYFGIRSAAATVAEGAQPLPVLKPEKARLTFTTAGSAAEPKTYYVAPDGDDDNTGLSREKAVRTVNRAAARVGPGDTVMIAAGDYNETVRIRAAGTKEHPILFRSITGEKAVFRGDNLGRAFEVIVKPDIRFDGLYFKGFDAFNNVFVVRQSPRVQITRCLNVMVAADESAGMLVRNCVARGGWTAVALGRSPDSIVENNVFFWTILRQLTCGASAIARNNIFCECLRGKTHQTLLELSANVAESNNCFYLRWPEDEKLAINNRTLPEYRARTGSDAMAANPMMESARGFCQGWPQGRLDDFPDCFAANPDLVRRGIGLQPEAFRDFQFKTNWVYDVKWAEAVIAGTNAAWRLVQAGKDVDALAAYTNLVAALPMSGRLKSDVLEQACRCAWRLKDYDRAIRLAKSIPVEPIAIRVQMEIMLDQGQYAALLKEWGGRSLHLGYIYPEQEDLMADLFQYRSMAYLKTNNVAAAEADLKMMNDKRSQLSYRAGEAIHDLAWLRVGDFFRIQLKDDDRALQAYTNILCRTTWAPWGRPPKPAATGGSETLVAATKAVCDILHKQGKDAEIPQLQFNLRQAQAEAAASVLKKTEMIAKFREAIAIPGRFTPELTVAQTRIEALAPEVKTNVVKAVAGMATGLTDDARNLLLQEASAPAGEPRETALRALLLFTPLDRINELLAKTDEAGRKAH
jgi:hypothetical protein